MLDPFPARGIARFLLPMADIMALLFSLFLLLPHLQQTPGSTAGAREARERRGREREELSRLRRERERPTGQRLKVVVLDIDAATGDLILREGPEPERIGEAGIGALIRRHQEAAREEEKELFFVLVAPRPYGVHPDRADERKYRRWFGSAQVDYRVDHPRLPE